MHGLISFNAPSSIVAMRKFLLGKICCKINHSMGISENRIGCILALSGTRFKYSLVTPPFQKQPIPLDKPSFQNHTAILKNLVNLSRITKPTGIWLLYLPCIWSTQLGTYSVLSTATSTFVFWNPKFLTLFLLGSIFMRTAGCVLNDIYDRKIDSLVERTSSRPLAAGTLSISTAYKFMGVLCVGGLGVLYCLPPLAAVIALGSVLPCIIYPVMKRITYYPQLVLGITFNWGALIGYPTVLLSLASNADFPSLCSISPALPVILPLYVGGIFWTLIYDTIYAHQDVKDDIKIGVKSTALKFGSNSQKILSLFSVLAILSFNLAGWMNGQSHLYFGLLNGGLFPFLLWQVNWADYSSRTSCWRMFSLSSYFGLAFFLIIFIDTYILYRKKKEEQREIEC